MFETIVLALDGSDPSKRAIPVAVDLAKRDGAKVVLAHVDERIAAKGSGDIHADEQEIQAEVRKLADELSGQGLDTGVRHSPVGGVLLGSVTQRLLHLAKQPVLVVP